VRRKRRHERFETGRGLLVEGRAVEAVDEVPGGAKAAAFLLPEAARGAVRLEGGDDLVVTRGDRRRQRGAEANPLTTDSLPVAHARLAHRHRADAGHDLALGQMPVTHNTLVARLLR
jgi:hypothetical protein